MERCNQVDETSSGKPPQKEGRRDSLREYLLICCARWHYAGIPKSEVEKLVASLEEHLRREKEQGASLQALVGSDPVAFADNWAETHLPRPSWAWRRNCYVTVFLLGLLFSVLLDHLLWLSWTFPFSWHQLGSPILAVLIAHLYLLPELGPPRTDPSWKRYTRIALALAVFGLLFLPTMLALLPVTIPVTLFLWSWPLTGVLVVGATGLTIWTIRSAPPYLHLVHQRMRS
ncbi:hypothetical protein EI42_06269 [Thermosporothrix hazakensis]|uniref:Uncharacterized protein n=2 Tax=Thermosporothrix TaxID=768650 RepID=A0A326TQM5_THEHA|nr:hypothetical protein EI42_06269 [Thermosporothrix hazakensis]BBH90569.1 hypothetical protein KTC_53200 [Thermosporothrix sp. COM3]GCE48621.1 hypothetical protein KTH_34900 [Thermosporothrix hazakensis]